MKIKVFVVTYNNNVILNDWALRTLFESNFGKNDVQIFVIANHTEDKVREDYQDKVTVLRNSLRPDFSTGHLSRNWNQAIVNGFQNLSNPDCDIVVCSQNDVKFKPDWLEKLLEHHKKYDFITFGHGDALHSYTPQAIKGIGLWDERFCNIGCQEIDYFARAYKYYQDKISINDRGGRKHSPPRNKIVESIIEETKTGHDRKEPSHMQSKKHHRFSHILIKLKWNMVENQLFHWEKPYDEKRECGSPQSMLYPYFENEIPEREKKGYLF